MTFKVLILPQAEEDAREYPGFIAGDSVTAARKWSQELADAIATLSSIPERFAQIPEEGTFRRTYRHFHHYSHRVIFFVDHEARVVVVARVFHGSRQPLRPDKLPS